MESDLGKFTGKDWSSLKSRLEILEKVRGFVIV